LSRSQPIAADRVPQADPAAGLETYLVGGAVRDILLGLPVTERDFVVVGATPDELLRRGFQQVGRDFPVFLHPLTKDEYALARTERKTAPGYLGFRVHAEPGVTLEEDLGRRDLTVNAIARSADGTYIDPHNGLQDLDARILRHVSPAFVEDPVRILRVARLASRFARLGFRVAPETRALMVEMVRGGEVDALVPERVWQEMASALGEARPSVFFEVLRDCGALARLLPELDRLWGVPQPAKWHPEIDTGVHVMLVLDMAARLAPDLEIRFAALCHDLGKGMTPAEILPSHRGHEERSVTLLEGVCDRFRIPNRCRELARITARYHGLAHKVQELRPGTIVDLIEGADGLRRPERFRQMLTACEADFRGRTGYEQRDYIQGDILRRLLESVLSVDAGAIARESPDPAHIPERLRAARVDAVRASRQTSNAGGDSAATGG
jgi:tRNA nucleotidyltransferase (CCA-adding enzyme)